MKKNHTFIIIILALLLVLSLANSYAQRGNGNHNSGHGGMGHRNGQHAGEGPAMDRIPPFGHWANELTDEQKTELRETIRTLRSEGKTPQEIHAAIIELFKKWNLEIPPMDFMKDHPDLTKEQRQELKELIQSMRDQDKTREEIHAAVVKLFEKWGIEPPPFGSGFFRGMRHWLGAQLTPEQKQIIRETIKTMRKEGASREEIRQAIRTLLEQWNIQPPENSKPPQDGQNRSADESKQSLALSNHPNPFNPSTTISYRIEQPDYVKLSIYNMQGQLIRMLADSYQNQGDYSVTWDGNDANGNRVASGVYVYKIEAGNYSASQQMTLTK